MTLKELEALETEVLTCKQIAPVLMANPATITGSRVKIPRIPFIMFMRGRPWECS